MKIRLIVALIGLAIGFSLPAFAQQTNTFQKVYFGNAITTGDQHIIGTAGNELSVIGRWSQSLKGFAPIKVNGYAWKERILSGLNWIRSSPVWSLPPKLFNATVKAPMTSLFAKK
jgi:hypothetical protein